MGSMHKRKKIKDACYKTKYEIMTIREEMWNVD